MAGSPLDDVAHAVKDAAYVSVGLSVIAFQRLQVRRNELTKALNASTGDARGTLGGLTGAVTEAVAERVKMVEERVEAAREQLTTRIAKR